MRAVDDWLRDYETFWSASLRRSKAMSRRSDERHRKRHDHQGNRHQASAERIYEALTNPEQRLKWWGAEGTSRPTWNPTCVPAARLTRGIAWQAFNVRGEYREIKRPRLLVFTWIPDWDENALESLVRFELEEKNGVTTVRVTHSGLVTESARSHHQGWPRVLAWLQAYAES